MRPIGPRPARPRRGTRLALALGALLFAGLALLAGCGGEPKPEVWIIGLDGADWDLLDPMIADGEMPNLARLRTEGAWGVLRSEKPLLSPILWTTIGSGHTPDTHGVTWFMTENEDGTKTPVSSAQRKVRSVWNIAGEAGLRSGVIGWWATWPADPVPGFMISDYVGWHSFGISGHAADDAGKTWPPELVDHVTQLLPRPEDVSVELLQRIVHKPAAELAFDPEADPYGDPISHLRQALATGRGYTDIALDRLRHDRTDFFAVYYEGTDAIMHLFGDYQPPRQPWVTDADYAAYKDAVRAYWQWQDGLLGELLAERGPATTVIVVSDHGFRMGDERRKEDAFHIETADADHMMDGIVVLNGPDVQPGARLHDADIYDVAPTVLYALDLPVAADMPGRVLTGALDAARVAARPIRSVATYEDKPFDRAEAVAGSAEASENLEQMLRSLGYIAGAEDASAGTHTAPEEVVNLALVLMRQGRYDEAIAKLREVEAENPGVMEIRLNLAQVLARSGTPENLAEAETLYRGLLAAYPDRLEVSEDLATMLTNAGRDDEAVAVYDGGLTRDHHWVNGLAGRGRALLRLGRTEAAVADLEAALAEDPRHAQAHLAYAVALREQGREAEAREHLTEAHRLEPADPAIALDLARALQADRRNAEAVTVLRRCLDNGGPQADVLAELGAALLRENHREEAVDVLTRAVELDRNNVTALGNLGMARAMAGEMPAAVAAFEQVVALQPDLPDGHAQLGALYAQTGQPERALRSLETAARLAPQNPAVQLSLGQVRNLNGDADGALAAVREAVRLDPDFTPAVRQLADLEAAAGNADAAARLRARLSGG